MSVTQPNGPACRPRPSATGESIRCHEETGLLAVFDLDSVPENPGLSGRMAAPDDLIRFQKY